MNVKKIAALLLAAVMLLGMVACDSEPIEIQEQETEPQATEPAATDPAVEVQPLESLSMTIMEADGSTVSLIVYPNYDGTVHLDYVGDVIKRAELEESVMDTISQVYAETGISALNGRYDEYNMVSGSFSATLKDGSYVGCEVYAETKDTLPAEFLSAYTAMDACFQELVKDVEEYIPTPMIMGEIAEADQAAIDGIMAGLTLENADAYAISGVVKDEYFATTMGLSSDAGIASGVQLAPMMLAQAYSLSIVTLEEGTDANTVAADFESNIDWRKWVCVAPDHALIAIQGNQVLILLGQGDAYSVSASAIEAAGWTTYVTLDNPDMGVG